MNFQSILNAVEPGSLLLAHASLKPCKAAGLHPKEVVRALLARLGPEGTLVMPTFSYCYLNHPRKEEFGKIDEIFVKQGFAKALGGGFLIDARRMVEFICEEIRKQPDVMLCSNLECEPCVLRRKQLQEY